MQTNVLKMMKAVFAVLLILMYKVNSGQSRAKQFVVNNAKTISSINPLDNDFRDLEAVRNAIGNKRVVMLGEIYHGAGTDINAKTRLVKFLHEKMGFNVLVFESDFFSLNNGWEMFENGKISLDSLIYLSVYPIWTRCSQFQSLQSYILNQYKAKKKLVISGMDNRGYSGYSLRHLTGAIDSFLHATSIPLVKDDKIYSEYYKLLMKAPALIDGENKQDMNKLMDYTENILNQLRTKEIKDSFYVKVIEGQLGLFKMAIHYKYDSTYILTKKNYPLHDLQMAENLKWLVTSKYATQKIIVWAHDAHIWKAEAGNVDYIDYNSMGHYFTRDKSMLSQTYIMGFTSFTGEGKLMLGNVPVEKVTRPKKNSIENWMHKIGSPYSFVDFSQLNYSNIKPEPFHMKTYINREAKSEWNKYYDGVFFIDKMLPCKRTRD
jgi:erythromycin esterase-like protein